MKLPPELNKIWVGEPSTPDSLIMETYIAGYAQCVKDANEYMLALNPELGTVADCARVLASGLHELLRSKQQ